jgi:hypothetical protein
MTSTLVIAEGFVELREREWGVQHKGCRSGPQSHYFTTNPEKSQVLGEHPYPGIMVLASNGGARLAGYRAGF